MNTTAPRLIPRRGFVVAALMLSTALLGGCTMMMAMMRNVPVPAASEFGLGPRASKQSMYSATIITERTLTTGRLQSVQLAVASRTGTPVTGATIAIDGGMPQHGHGLPNKPRVTKELGDGKYQVDGLRFSMGGWWELKFAIRSAAGADTVVFNIKL